MILIARPATLCRILPERLLVILLEDTQVIRQLDYEPIRIHLRVSSRAEAGVRLRSCAKEPDTIRWIESFKADEVFFDIGANVGAYSLVASLGHAGIVPVYAFEPSAPTFARLCENLTLNHCQDVVPLSMALSDHTGLERFNYSSLSPGNALHTLGMPFDYKNERFEPVARIFTLTFKLDDLIELFKLPTPTHLKIDVDGLELAIIRGAWATIRDSRVKSILVEVREDSRESQQIIRLVNDAGLTYAGRHPYLDKPSLGIANYLFIRNP